MSNTSLEGLHLHTAATVTCFRDDIIGCHVALYTFQPQKEIICESHTSLISCHNLQQTEAGARVRHTCLHTVCSALWDSELYFILLYFYLKKANRGNDRMKRIGFFGLMGACFLHQIKNFSGILCSLNSLVVSLSLFFSPNLKNIDKNQQTSSPKELSLFLVNT